MNATYLVRAALGVSLAANVALGWMLWQKRMEAPAKLETGLTVQSVLRDSDLKPVDLWNLPALPAHTDGVSAEFFVPSGSAPASVPVRTRMLQLRVSEGEPYGPPPPSNPHAVPPWPERLPYRENQIDRGLYSTPLKLDKP